MVRSIETSKSKEAKDESMNPHVVVDLMVEPTSRCRLGIAN